MICGAFRMIRMGYREPFAGMAVGEREGRNKKEVECEEQHVAFPMVRPEPHNNNCTGNRNKNATLNLQMAGRMKLPLEPMSVQCVRNLSNYFWTLAEKLSLMGLWRLKRH